MWRSPTVPTMCSELKGFPGPTGASRAGERAWHLARRVRRQLGLYGCRRRVYLHHRLYVRSDGTLYVVEIDEASFSCGATWRFPSCRAHLGGTAMRGSSTWARTEVAMTPIPSAAGVDRGDGTVYAAISALVPDAAQVIALAATTRTGRRRGEWVALATPPPALPQPLPAGREGTTYLPRQPHWEKGALFLPPGPSRGTQFIVQTDVDENDVYYR